MIDGKVIKKIDRFSLVKGFALSLEDSSYTIFGYCLSYDHTGELSEMLSRGARIVLVNTWPDFPGDIRESTLVTIDNIRVGRNGTCYRLPPLVYCTR